MDGFTEFILRETLDISKTVVRALRKPQDLVIKDLLARWTSLQVGVGELLQGEFNRDELSAAQFDFAMEWLSNLDVVPHDEAQTNLEAFLEWRRGA
jgi:hypothetical protein